MISLKQIRYALAVEKHLHFNKAAEECAISQSALSTAIQEMEKQLGFQVFERDNKKVLVTPLGKDLLDKARLVYLQINDISEKQQVEHMKSVFVATVSHELRTPLTSIRGALAILDDSAGAELSSSARRLLDIAQTNSDRLIELVNDILDLERIETGRLEFAFSKESAWELMEEAQAQIMPYAARLGIKTELRAPEGEDLMVWCDRGRIGQVFSNLVSNACKFSKSGDTVTIEAQKEGDLVKFMVRDQGKGVPDSFRGNIFKPFSQADGTDTREKGGTGLGLSIAKQLVERMGGDIGYESVPNVETVFWFTSVLHNDSLEDQQQVLGRMAIRV